MRPGAGSIHMSRAGILAGCIASMSPYEATHIEEALKNLLQENNLKPGDIFPMLRIALAGTMQGPAVFDMMELLGKTESIARIDRLVGSIKI